MGPCYANGCTLWFTPLAVHHQKKMEWIAFELVASIIKWIQKPKSFWLSRTRGWYFISCTIEISLFWIRLLIGSKHLQFNSLVPESDDPMNGCGNRFRLSSSHPPAITSERSTSRMIFLVVLSSKWSSISLATFNESRSRCNSFAL